MRKLLELNELRRFVFAIIISMNMKISALALSFLVGLSFSADPRMEQGAIFEAKGNYEMALGEYRAILAEQPKNADAYFAAAEVRMKMKDYSGALANYRLAYKFEPTKSAAYEGAAKVYEALGQKSKADAERAKDPKNNPAPAVEEAAAPVATAPAVPAPEPAKVSEPAPVAAPAEPAKVEPAKTETAKAEPAKVEAKPVEAKPAEVKPAETKSAEAKPAETPKAAEPVKTAAPAAASAPAAAPAEPAKTLPADPFEKGKVLYAEGNYTEAAKAWREVLKKTPGHTGAYFYAGLTRYQLGEYEKAEFNLKKGLEYKEEGNDANYFLACIYQKQNKPDQELKFLANYMKKAAPNGKYRKAAEERLAAIKAAKAEAAKEEVAVAESPKTEPAKSETVPAETQAAAPVAEAPAAVAAENDMAAQPTAVPTIANANLLFSAGSYDLALQMYKSLLETEQNPEERYFTMLQLGNVYRELQDFHSAVTRYREVVQQFPDSDWATEAERALEDAVWLEKHAKELPRKVR